jgi:hypothetical protein
MHKSSAGSVTEIAPDDRCSARCGAVTDDAQCIGGQARDRQF